jgi:nucleoprotein TPR
MLTANYALLEKENTELKKRSQVLSESSAKQDMRTQQVAEDLVEAKGLLESMRNENANLKAEKKLWKDIQDRLNQDNEGLMNERTRLNNLVANQQTLQNERELADSETRRRLQAQVESLEAELSTTKRKLNDEIEDSKKAQLRKEYDSQQNQKRIDDLASTLSQAREELVAAKTTRDHLQARVDELTIELKSAEERVELLQPRPTPRPGTNGQTAGSANEALPEGELTREQELAIEVSELKRDLDLSKSELENAKSQMEQYKSISQSSEEELQSLNATQDQYREEMDHIIEEKDAKIRELQQRVDDISAELSNTNNELTTLRNQQSEVARQVEEEKAILEAEISRLKDEDERHATAAQFHQQDLRAQAAIATKAQQDYENELVKHAEATKLLQELRAEHNQLKTQSASLKADAESARATLSQNESSWEERRQHFEQELKELRTRRDDLNAQNKLLHQQLEGVGAQVAALQQSRITNGESLDFGSSAAESSNDRAADGLRELNAFLRREKEIVEVQYDLKVQEAKRLQQKLDYAQSQLDESRLKLDQERRLHADGGRNSVAHKDLMEKLNELNLMRESSVTLRNEARQAQTQLAEKSKRVDELMEQIEPLETKIREFEHGKETMEGEMRLLQEDRDRWQKRTQDIMSKYDRVDPAEMEQLKESLESLRAERDSLLEEQRPLQEKLQSLESEKGTWQQSRAKLIEQAKEKSRVQSKEIKDKTTERDSALQEKETLQEQLSGLQQQLQIAVRDKEAAEQQLAVLNQELENVKSERDRALASVSQAPDQAPATPASQRANLVDTQQLADLRKQLDQVTHEKQSLATQLKELREQLEISNSERDTAIAEAAAAQSRQTTLSSDTTMQNGNEEGQIDEAPSRGLSDNERRALQERIAAAEAKFKEQEEKARRIEEHVESTLKTRSEKMKDQLNKRLVQAKETQKAELEAEYKLKLDQEKQIWLAESKSAAPPLNVVTNQPKPTENIPAPPATPTPGTPSQKPPQGSPSLSTLSDKDVREILQNNATAREIFRGNLTKRVTVETQKLKDENQKLKDEAQTLKDEHAKVLAEVQQKAEAQKVQSVMMETKKSALKLNMSDNKARLATGKLEIVEKAAQETPQKPVVEVWEEVKTYKLPPAATASSEPTSQSNGTSAAVSKPLEVKTEAPSNGPPQAAQAQPSSTPALSNGTPAAASSNIPVPSQPGNPAQRVSSLPTMRGSTTLRGRGGAQVYQARGGGQVGQGGRGRGGPSQRGGLNASATPYSPTGPAGIKRAREEGSIGGPQQANAGKRPRGGGPN